MGEEWKQYSAKMRDEMGVSAKYAPWTQKPGILLRGVPHVPRYLDVLDMAWISRRKKCPQLSEDEARMGFYADFSSAVQRSPWGSARTLTQGQLISRLLTQLEFATSVFNSHGPQTLVAHSILHYVLRVLLQICLCCSYTTEVGMQRVYLQQVASTYLARL